MNTGLSVGMLPSRFRRITLPSDLATFCACWHNASPFFSETLKQMADDGVKRALGFILSSHRSEASWERYQKNIADARAELGAGAPEVDYCDGWHDHPLFVQSWVELIQSAMTKIDAAIRLATPLVFTAHSLPVRDGGAISLRASNCKPARA